MDWERLGRWVEGLGDRAVRRCGWDGSHPRDHEMGAGAFVYQGSGKRHGPDAERCQVRCASRARDLQWCMSRRGYDQARCKGYLEAWQQCTSRCRGEEEQGEGVAGRAPGASRGGA